MIDERPATPVERLLLDVHGVCQLLGISRSTLHKWSTRGFMPSAIKIGDGPKASVRWSKHELEDWVRSGGVKVMARCDEARRLRDEANAKGIRAVFMVSDACDEPELQVDETFADDHQVDREIDKATAETN